jgi:hypothetical protein
MRIIVSFGTVPVEGSVDLSFAVMNTGGGTLTGSVGATVNIFFVLTFAAVAVSMLLVLRALGISRGVAAVIALLYTFLPYHFARGVPHLFLSAYWVVPLAGYLVLRTASRRPPFVADPSTENSGDGEGWRVDVADRSTARPASSTSSSPRTTWRGQDPVGEAEGDGTGAVVAAATAALTVIEGGELGERKGINAPGVPLPASAITLKDADDLTFGLSLGVDLVALSFVQSAADLQQARRLMTEQGQARSIL